MLLLVAIIVLVFAVLKGTELTYFFAYSGYLWHLKNKKTSTIMAFKS